MGFEMRGTATMAMDAPPERVYAIVSDITRMGEWSPECTGGSWTNGSSSAAVGATFDGHNARGGNEWTTPNTILRADEPSVFEWVVGTPENWACRWTFVVEPSGAGSTVTESFELGPIDVGFRSMVNGAAEDQRDAMVAGRRAQLESDMADTLARIKTAAEAS